MSVYWQGRFEYLNEQLLNEADNYIPYMEKEYRKAVDNIQKEINHFYGRFAVNNEISYQEARKLLTHGELETFKMTLSEYIEKAKLSGVSKEWIKEVENASTAYRISRLKALQIQMRQQIELLEAAKEQGFKSVAETIYTEGYYKSVYEIQKGLGVGSAFATLDTNASHKVLSKPWQADGLNFSERIWGKDRTALVYQLETRFTQAMIRGDNPVKIADIIAKELNTSFSAAKRLLLTESAYFATAARFDAFKELGVERYQVFATLDRKTSDICIDMDLKVFKLSEKEIGVTAPPFHPNCRTTTAPYFNDEFTQGSTRAARGTDGKSYSVPADMTYKQWKEKYAQKR